MVDTDKLYADIVIIGGGVAGLWTLNHLRNKGYSALLFEQEALGSYQTVGSQGMIHGGIKYALSGALNKGSEAIAAMPETWRQCLRGEGDVDLRGCKVLSEDFFLWSIASLNSRLTSFFASKMTRTRAKKLTPRDYPAPFLNPGFKGEIYRLVDLVLDMPSMIETLYSRHQDAIFKIDWETSKLECKDGQATLQIPGCEIIPERLILTAGAGNEALIKQLGGSKPAMQRRPLRQVLVKHEYQESLYAHCMGGKPSPSPRLTVSSHRTSQGEPVWYLGGDLATENMRDSNDVLIDKARAELAKLFPWINFGKCEWTTLTLDRAEPKQSTLLKPDEAYVGKVDSVDNALAAWPTKLTLSPNLASSIEETLTTAGVKPKHKPDLSSLASLGKPPIAPTCWDTLFK